MKTPDIEIYVKNADMAQISKWLENSFSTVDLPPQAEQIFLKGKAIRATVRNNDEISDLVITPEAAGKAFSSIWFKKNITNWENDEKCAQSLLKEVDTEIRCSASGWTEDEEEQSEQSEQWLLLTRNEKKLINWG